MDGSLTPTNTPPGGLPTISGTAEVGQTLTASTTGITDDDGLATPGWTYQWIRVDTEGTETDIPGATSQTYTLVSGDEVLQFRVRVSFTDDGSASETLRSAIFPSSRAPSAPETLSLTTNRGDVTLDWTPRPTLAAAPSPSTSTGSATTAGPPGHRTSRTFRTRTATATRPTNAVTPFPASPLAPSTPSRSGPTTRPALEHRAAGPSLRPPRQGGPSMSTPPLGTSRSHSPGPRLALTAAVPSPTTNTASGTKPTTCGYRASPLACSPSRTATPTWT